MKEKTNNYIYDFYRDQPNCIPELENHQEMTDYVLEVYRYTPHEPWHYTLSKLHNAALVIRPAGVLLRADDQDILVRNGTSVEALNQKLLHNTVLNHIDETMAIGEAAHIFITMGCTVIDDFLWMKKEDLK